MNCQAGMNYEGFYVPCTFRLGHDGPHSFEKVTAEWVINLLREWKRAGCMDQTHYSCERCTSRKP